MKLAITGGTGFVGSHLALELLREGHEVVLITRAPGRRVPAFDKHPRVTSVPVGLGDPAGLERAFSGVDGVAHCAGINRESGSQTYARVHVEGTRQVTQAAQRAGLKKIVLLSFLRARPKCGSPYHESKWAAEEIVRGSGIDFTILKAGVIYGKGDHMLDHLSHAFYTFPLFGLVGFQDRRVRPVAVAEVVRILKAALCEPRLTRQTVTVLGPEELTLRAAVQRVAEVVGRRPLMFPLPLAFHYLMAWCLEWCMPIPLVSRAQVRILSEGIVEPWPPCGPLPADLAPRLPFSREQIQRGLPAPGPFGWRDCRCWSAVSTTPKK